MGPFLAKRSPTTVCAHMNFALHRCLLPFNSHISGISGSVFVQAVKVWVPVMHFCACPIHCRVHWSVGRRLGLCR